MPVPALIACTSPAFVRPTFPMLSRWVTTPSRYVRDDLHIGVAVETKTLSWHDLIVVPDHQGTKGPVGRIAVRTYYKVVIGLEPAKITAVERR